MGQIHPVAFEYFKQYPLDREIVQPFLSAFDVTTAFRKESGRGRVAVFYLKPERFIAEFLGLERELLLVYAPFTEFQARTIQFHDEVLAADRVRLDPLGSLVVTDAHGTRELVRSIVESNPERLPVAGLSKKEVQGIRDADDLRALLVREFFRRDLFALESPLTMDTSFFGRGDIVDQLFDRFKQGQNSGLFGLRRIGKTSVLYALDRRISAARLGRTAYLDLRSPSLHRSRWWKLLEEIVRRVAKDLAVKAGRSSKVVALGAGYTEEEASASFRSDMEWLRRYFPDGRLLLALDEIEHITFDISPAAHWSDDFLPFWQTLQAVHQETSNSLCFVIAGVNPHPVEKPTISRFDNPLFLTLKPFYLQPFTGTAVREMARRLGRFMGLRFDEQLYGLLSTEYGGHPFLVRQACSHLAALVQDRPASVSTELFRSQRDAIAVALEKNVKYILQVLEQWYPQEFELISELASGNVETFREFAKTSAEFTEHMEGYGLVRDARKSPNIAIDLVRVYLARLARRGMITEAAAEDIDAVQAEISRRRNRIETRLREVLQEGLRFAHGKRAAARALAALTERRREDLAGFSYEDSWGELYFDELSAIMFREWDSFQNYFSEDGGKVQQWMDHVNRSRADAHAKSISNDDLAFLRVCFRRLEEKLLGVAVER